MRLIIKNADFSQVSIGKVVEDLSFAFDSSNGAGGGTGHGDVDVINAFFPNFNSGTPTATDIYIGSEGGEITTMNNANRIVSDFIEVSEGMTIYCERLTGASNSPNLIAFNASKEIVSSACVWAQQSAPYITTKVIPAGVKYIKFQNMASEAGLNVLLNGYVKCSGTMPE